MLLKNRCGMREVNEKTSGMWECPSSKQWEAGGRSKKSKRSKIVVGGGRREGGQKWHWEAGCRTKMKREARCCTRVSPALI